MRKSTGLPEVGEAYRGYAADIHRSGLHLLGVVNDVLDLAKAEAGAMTLDLREVDLGLVVAEAVHMLARKAETGGGLRALIFNRSEREHAMETLLASEWKYRDLLNNVIEGVYQLAPNGTILTANPAITIVKNWQTRLNM